MRQGDKVKVRENRGLMARGEAGKAWKAWKINRGMWLRGGEQGHPFQYLRLFEDKRPESLMVRKTPRLDFFLFYSTSACQGEDGDHIPVVQLQTVYNVISFPIAAWTRISYGETGILTTRRLLQLLRSILPGPSFPEAAKVPELRPLAAMEKSFDFNGRKIYK